MELAVFGEEFAVGEACRAMLRETLRDTLAWAIDQIVNHSKKHNQIIAQLGLS